MKVLIVDDEPDVVEALAITFSLQQHWTVDSALDGETAVEKFFENIPDLVILDIALPGMDGYEVLRRIRRVSEVPILMLTVKGEEMSKVKALELGADDYVVKPPSSLELLARVNAVLRRTAVPRAILAATPLVLGDLQIDFIQRELTVGGRPVKLSPREFDLLVCLARNAGRTISSRNLLTSVWGPEFSNDLDCLKTSIRRLRQKVESDPSRPRYIKTVRGTGYQLVPPR